MIMKKRNAIIVLSFIFILISAVCYSCKFNKDKSVILSGIESNSQNSGYNSGVTDINNNDTKDIANEFEKTEQAQSDLIAVHICGAVKQPGVYEIADGSRLFELINLAGGLEENAAGDYINQAEKVEDGQRYYIPTLNEMEDLSVSEKFEGLQSNDKESKQKLVNINTADAEELMTLPGIGEAKAKSIIDYRNNNGKFKNTEELMNIPGIKEGLYSKIASMIEAK